MKIKIEDNPFVSKIYQTHWKNSYGEKKQQYSSEAISNISFLKYKYFPIYTNIGKTNSSGISYEITQSSDSRDANKVFLIYDVPQYFDIPHNNPDYKTYRVKQYKGYVIDLKKYESVSDFIANRFNQQRKKTLKYGVRRLERDHDINIAHYHGKIEWKKFNEIFEVMFGFLDRRFESMGIKNAHGSPTKKEWLRNLCFDLINNEKAVIMVVNDADKPIAISLCYLSKNILYPTFPSFDLKYSRHGMGNYLGFKELEWAFENGYSLLDMGKGNFGYKDKWSTLIYPYEYHIVFKKNSLVGFSIATYLRIFFTGKQWVRVFRDKYLKSILGILKK
nr:GNAT family N-acetyltransferase [uncultured Allomuricauda sp.]